MINSSVRRAVATVSQQTPVFTTLSTAPRAAVSLCHRGHQRRYSSSKPSSPDNGPKDLAAGQSVPAAAKPSDAKTSGEKRKRRAKDASEMVKKLPVVPSTAHLSPEALGLSTFFSLHRPISVTHTFPKTVTDDAFASIFTPRTQAQRVADVTSTLSHTVDSLEGPMAKMTLGNQMEDMDNSTRIDLKHPDGSESAVYVQLNSMSGQFLPFSPPPLPEQPGSVEMESAAEVEEIEPSHRVYKAVLTIEETTDADGQVKVVAHSPQLIEEDVAPRTFLERMALRQLKYEDALRTRLNDMHAISVKRQKKLKMKKKKYKKLMKRTRNERRKLDRI